jgi:pimeloyl-ACP methyl ester carboxylesterase
MIDSATRTVRASDGATIAFEVRGEGPQTLLLLHGWGGSGTGFFWNETLSHLDLTGLQVVLADLRGHGRSDQVEGGFTTEQFAEDMFAVVDAVGAASVVVVGYSMSGRWAQWMACSQPERVHGLVLIAPVPGADIPFPDELKAQWLQVARERRIETFTPWVHQFTKEALAAPVLSAYFESVTSTAELSLGATLDMCRQQGQFIDRLSATRARTLVIGGLADPILPPGVLREAVVAPIPGARLVALDCGHEIPLEQPQAMAMLLEAFLAGLGPSA